MTSGMTSGKPVAMVRAELEGRLKMILDIILLVGVIVRVPLEPTTCSRDDVPSASRTPFEHSIDKAIEAVSIDLR
jgi:hypothetical protein